MREIVPCIHVIDGLKTGRSYLAEGDDGLCLVDSSTAGVAARILDAVAQLGRQPEDLKLIVATHYHHDHTGNVAELVKRTGAQLAVHSADVPYVEGGERWMSGRGGLGGLFDAKQYMLSVDRVLNDGDELPFAGGLQVLHAPGHTPGHIALYSRTRGVLFAGDAFGNWLGLQPPISMYSHDMGLAKQTIQALAELEFDVALPGHGAPVVNRASEKVAQWARTWL